MLNKLKIRIFADGADKNDIFKMNQNKHIAGFTTNPTLMRKAGISDYKLFAKDILATINDKPISFEVFADELTEMEAQAREIASWGNNVYVKIPVMNTKGVFTGPIIKNLNSAGIKLNITAVFTLEQVKNIMENIQTDASVIISIFSGRIADTGIDPVPMMQQALTLVEKHKNIELLWASPRELLNILQADQSGCHIITASIDILNKLTLIGKNLEEYSRETVNMFYQDAQAAGYKIPLAS